MCLDPSEPHGPRSPQREYGSALRLWRSNLRKPPWALHRCPVLRLLLLIGGFWVSKQAALIHPKLTPLDMTSLYALPPNAFDAEQTKRSKRRARRQRLIHTAKRLARVARNLLRSANKSAQNRQTVQVPDPNTCSKLRVRRARVAIMATTAKSFAQPFSQALQTYEGQGEPAELILQLGILVRELDTRAPQAWLGALSPTQRKLVEGIHHDAFTLQGDIHRAMKEVNDPYPDRKRGGFTSRAKDLESRLAKVDRIITKLSRAGSTVEGQEVKFSLSEAQASILEIYFADPAHQDDIGVDSPEGLAFARSVHQGLRGNTLTLKLDKALFKHAIVALDEIAEDLISDGLRAEAKAAASLSLKFQPYLK